MVAAQGDGELDTKVDLRFVYAAFSVHMGSDGQGTNFASRACSGVIRTTIILSPGLVDDGFGRPWTASWRTGSEPKTSLKPTIARAVGWKNTDGIPRQ
jgi:hypothetical protein